MKIAEYKQMMEYLTRPGFNGGGSVRNKTVLPKKKPEEEVKKRKIKNFEKAKPALENPKEVKEMIDKPKRGLVDEPGSYSGDKREALKNWMSSQKGDIKRTDLVKKVDEIFDVSDAVKHTSRLIKNYPDLFKDFKILEKADITGTKDFKNFLEKTKSKKLNVPELIKEFKKKTGKDITLKNANFIATEFSDKFKLKAGKRDIVYTKSELAAAKKYKNLTQETKFDFQTGGPAQANKYNNFLKNNNIEPTKNNKKRFTSLLKEQGLYVKAPVRDPGQAKNLKRRKTNIQKTGNFNYEESLSKYKAKILESLGVPKDKIKGGGERAAIQLAHRLSFDQLAVLGGQYSGENIGADVTRINVEDAKILENELKPLYKKQASAVRIAKKFPTGKIPKQLSETIDNINFQISELVAEKSKGRIQGVQVDPKNLKVYSTPVDAKFSAAFGVDTTKPYKNMKGSLARKKYLDDVFFKLNFAEQIKNEALQSGLIKDAPKNFEKTALNLAVGDTSTRAAVASMFGAGQKIPSFGKAGQAAKILAKGESILAPLFFYGGAAYGLPYKRALYESTYGFLGESKSDVLKRLQPTASTSLDFNNAQQKYNTLLNNYNNASREDKLILKDKMAQKTKEFQNLKNQYESLPLPERIQSEAAAGKAETQYEDLIKSNRERRFQYGLIPKKELFIDIKDYFGNIGKNVSQNVRPTENVLGTTVPMGTVTGQTQYDFAGGGRVGFDNGGLSRLMQAKDVDLKTNPVGIVMEGEPKSSNFDNDFLNFIEEIKEKANEPIKYTDGTTYYPEFNSFFNSDFNEVSGPSKGAIPVDERNQEVIPKERLEAAGGGIMKMAGKSSGPAPESGPTPQGLDFLMKRGR